MSDKKIAGEDDIIAGWTEDEINNLELSFLHKMFNCKDVDGVDTTVFFAKYMSKVTLDSDNYPIFLKLLQLENHWVTDALVGKHDPEKIFDLVQPNMFILSACFKMFTRWKPNGIYSKSLLVLFGLLKKTYSNPHEGYKVYPITITDINNLGKHLDKEKDQRDPMNRVILEILDKISSLYDPGGLPAKNKEVQELAVQANNIRGKFLDYTKHLNEAIPDLLLIKEDYTKNEIAPSVVPNI